MIARAREIQAKGDLKMACRLATDRAFNDEAINMHTRASTIRQR